MLLRTGLRIRQRRVRLLMVAAQTLCAWSQWASLRPDVEIEGFGILFSYHRTASQD